MRASGARSAAHMTVAGSRACTSDVYSTAGRSLAPVQPLRPSVTHHTWTCSPRRVPPAVMGVLTQCG
eukprot:3944953-Prymnesium_polylepis.1